MSKLTRIRHGQTGDRDAAPRFVELGSEEEDRVFDALSSETARRLYRLLHEEPRTPSALAEETGKSVQTVSYHLTKLDTAGLVEEAGTHYSEKGREMTVWAPADGAVVIAEDVERARDSLASYLAGLLGVGVVGLAAQYAADRFVAATPTGSGLLEPASRGGSPSSVDGPVQLLASVLSAVEPGLLVFACGLLVLAAVYYRRELA